MVSAGRLLLVLGLLCCGVSADLSSTFASNHTNNWAVLVATSRFWFNYRHIANTLSLYRTVKRLGIPDSQIILMLPDDMACNPRNAFPARIFNNRAHNLDLYSDDIEVDYRGTDVTVANFLRLLTGRHQEHLPRSKRLSTDSRSNILIYMSGHGGDEFLKFNDNEEVNSWDIADAMQQMHIQERYNEIFFMVDTCQASTLHKRFYAPNVVSIGSSLAGENSYSHHLDSSVGLSVIDRFTFYTLEFMERAEIATATVQDLFSYYQPSLLMSTPGPRKDLFRRPLDQVLLSDFFGAVTHILPTPSAYDLAEAPDTADAIFDTPVTPAVKPQSKANRAPEPPAQPAQPGEQPHGFRLDPLVLGWLLAIIMGLVLGHRLEQRESSAVQ